MDSVKRMIYHENSDKIEFIIYEATDSCGFVLVHNENGPAILNFDIDGNIISETYMVKHNYHREEGPAYIRYYPDGKINYVEFYKDNKRHNENGPSVIYYYPDGSEWHTQYHLNGKGMDEKKWQEKTKVNRRLKGTLLEGKY